MKVRVLRIEHRKKRDVRVSSHCALAARALGANEFVLSGEKDEGLIESVKDVAKRWGGKYYITQGSTGISELKKAKKQGFKIVHLTMYGLPLKKEISKIRKNKKVCVIAGSAKVPGEIYRESDYNIAITGQPHSEIAALGVFLHELFKGKELENKFKGAQIQVIPDKSGKKVKKIKK